MSDQKVYVVVYTKVEGGSVVIGVYSSLRQAIKAQNDFLEKIDLETKYYSFIDVHTINE